MSSYKKITAEDARRYLLVRDGENPLLLDDLIIRIGDGPLLGEEVLDDLRVSLLAIKLEFPAELPSRSPHGGQFEQRACEFVHRALSSYPILALADPGFWTWLAVVKFADVIEWRFGSSGQVVNLANYGIGNSAENMLFRLWLRGDIAYEDDAPDPYELARTGDQDLWRSHIIRQGYANAREIAKALLRLQADRLEHSRLGVEGIRDLAKSLRRLHANVFFDLYTPTQANELILELSSGLSHGGRPVGGQ